MANVKIGNISEIFTTMEYGPSSVATQSASDWIKAKESTFFTYINTPTEKPNGDVIRLHNAVDQDLLCTIYEPNVDTINTILAKESETKWIDLDSFERGKILNRIGCEIEKKGILFAQLDLLSRGILINDTITKAIPQLVQYFQYYSAFSYSEEDTETKSPGVAVGVITNENFLAYLGLFLAPALAAGRNTILQVGLELAPAAFLLEEIARSVGLPTGVIRIVPSDNGDFAHYLICEKVEILTIFAELNNKVFHRINNTFNKKILSLTSYKTPAIVFDSADLDAACEGVVESSWSYQSKLPWTTDTVLVQENILPTFLNKLKESMKSFEISKVNNIESQLKKFDELVKQAKLEGIEVFNAQENPNEWGPTLFIGGQVQHTILDFQNNDTAVVTVLAFRSIDEAISLANNTRQGLWASVWSENSSVVNEVTRKLKVSNIFVNGCCGFSPDVVLSPTKESGIGNFGGKEGFVEYLPFQPTKSNIKNKSAPVTVTNIDSIITTAKKAQEGWRRTPRLQKQKIFLEFAELLLSTLIKSSEIEKEWTLKHIYEAIKGCSKDSIYPTLAGYNLTSYREPRGVIVIDQSENNNAQLILTSLFEGNALIVLITENTSMGALKLLSSKIPSGVLNLVNYSSDLLKEISLNKNIACYFGDDSDNIFKQLPIIESKNYRIVSNNKEDLYNKIGIVKNIWTDIGKSSTNSF